MKTLFAYHRNGKWESVDLTMRDLLIGYDMMPLIGLPAMKARLAAKGSFHRVAVRLSTAGEFFALCRRGSHPVLDFLAWGGLPQTRASAARSACGYLSDGLSGDAREEANRLWYGSPVGQHGPAKVALRFLAERGYTVKRIELVVVERSRP